MISFGEWLHRFRDMRGLSQAGLGEVLRYSTESVRKYESRGNRPSAGFATSLADYVGLNGPRAKEFLVFVRGARADKLQHVSEWIADQVEPSQTKPAATNLPVPLTRLVGRDDEVEQQFAVFARPEVRLLTCMGSAGTGKTRLALAIAERMRTVAWDGVYLVELAPVLHPQDIERAIADSLRLRDIAGRTTLETLTDYLRPKHALLVLDNLEHLAVALEESRRGVAQRLIGGLLEHAPFLRVLATSRVRLHVAGERLYRLQPLRLPDTARQLDLKTLVRNPAVELFVDRVRDADPSFTLDASNAEAIVGICRSVDGIPLALELAAARCDTLDPHTLNGILGEQNRLATLNDGPLDQDERHRTLRTAIGWSFSLLDAPGQRLFASLGVFVGGSTASAANAVLRGVRNASPSNERETAGLLSSLVDASLLRLTREPGSRYTMLETLREFALEQLGASDERDAAAREHAFFYVEFAERIEPELVGRDQARWMATCEVEHENVRAALRWLLDHDELQAAARLASALWRFWWTRGHLTDGRAWLDIILRSSSTLTPRQRARVLTGDGILARTQRSFERASQLLSEALGIWKHLNNVDGTALALVNLGIVAEQMLEYDLARARYTECLDYYRQSQDERGEAHVLNNLSVVAIDEGHFDEAAEFGLQSLEIFQRLRVDDRGLALVLRNLGWIATAQRNFQAGREWLESSLAIHRRLGDQEGIGQALNNLAWLTYTAATGDDAEYRLAYAIAGDALGQLYELADYAGMAESIEFLSGCAGKLGEPRAAARGFGAAEALRASVGIAHFPSMLGTYRTMVAEARQQLDQASWSEAWSEGASRPDDFIAEILGRIGANSAARHSPATA
jgi:predicted ATPase/transcriptional regulator with XRE-family HTH domain